MDRRYFGDAYDLAKRFLLDSAKSISEVICIPMFTNFSEEEKEGFSKLIGARVIDEEIDNLDHHLDGNGIFLDPNTGVADQSSNDHVSFDQIASLLDKGVKFVIAFDQSFKRIKGNNKKEQIFEKIRKLREKEIHSFYYVSHACFLFASSSKDLSTELRQSLLEKGIPRDRLIGVQQMDPVAQ